MSCKLILKLKWSINKQEKSPYHYPFLCSSSILSLCSSDSLFNRSFSYCASTFTESILVLILNSISYKGGWFKSTTNTLILSLLPRSRLKSSKLDKASCNRSYLYYKSHHSHMITINSVNTSLTSSISWLIILHNYQESKKPIISSKLIDDAI